MKVRHLITTIERGGAEIQLLTLVEQQVLQGKRVEILYLKGTPVLEENFQAVGAKVVGKLANQKPIIQLFKLRKILAAEAQVIHCHLPRAELMAAFVNCAPFVVTRHNAEKFFPSAPNWISSLLSRFVIRRARVCIAISYAVKEFLTKQREIPRGKDIEVVHYGIDINKFIPVRVYPRSFDSIKLGTISRLVPQKNLQMLLLGFHQLLKSHPSSTLKIVGKGHLERELKELAETKGLDSQITWIPEISDVPKFFSEIDVFCLTSNYEGFGLVLLESMACRVPIISKASPATIEVLGGDYEYLLPRDDPKDFSNAVISLSNVKEFEKISLRNEQRLRHFSANEMEKQISDLYSTLKQQ